MSNPFDSGNNEPQKPEYGGQESGQESSYGQQGYGQQDYGQPYPGSASGYDQANQYGSPLMQREPGKFDALESIGQGWKVFAERPAAWVVSAIVYMAIFGVLYLVGLVPFIAWNVANTDEYGNQTASPSPSLIITFFVSVFIAVVVLVLWELVMYRVAFEALSGAKPEIKNFFNYSRVGIIFLTSLVTGLLTILGVIALVIGMFVVAFFLTFAVAAAAVPGATVGDSLKKSFEVVKRNPLQTLIFAILITIINGIGGAVWIGMVITYPITIIATMHALLTATNGPVQQRA